MKENNYFNKNFLNIILKNYYINLKQTDNSLITQQNSVNTLSCDILHICKELNLQVIIRHFRKKVSINKSHNFYNFGVCFSCFYKEFHHSFLFFKITISFQSQQQHVLVKSRNILNPKYKQKFQKIK